ncbi:MAG TPA: DHA2 family efflux MFS transporter permease subunit [Ktedonobacterales bacterium]
MPTDRRWQIAMVAVLGLFMAVLDTSIVYVALPPMQQDFHTDLQTIVWVATAYFLAQAAVIPIAGYLSDRIGTKTVFITALALFTIGSALCVVAPTKEALIAFRVAQGIGGGALFPIGFAIIFRAFPPAQRGAASAFGGVAVLLAPVLGPTIGGYLTTTFDWRAIFLINVPIGIVALTLAALVLPSHVAEQAAMGTSSASPAGKGFDAVGLVLAMAGFTALSYGVSQAGSHGWGDSSVIHFALLGSVLLAALVVVELVVSNPVLDVRLFRNYTFSMANLLNWALGALIFGSLFMLPLFFENVQGRTPLVAGAILVSQGLGAAVANFAAGALYNRVGPRIIVTIGFVLMAIATLGLRQLDVGTTWQALQVWLVLRGAALGLVNVPLQTLSLSVVSNRALARASSLVNVNRQVFTAVGVAALTAYLTQQAHTHGSEIAASFHTQPPTGVAATCLSAAGQSATALATCAQHYATTLGLNDTFTILTLACAVAAVLAVFLGRDPNVTALKRMAPVTEEPIAAERPALVAE